jgi:hypothetical protein
MIKNLLANWKTTSAGLAMIISSTVHLIIAVSHGTSDEQTWTTGLMGIVGGIGLLAAGDSAVSATKTETAVVNAKVDLNTQAIQTGDTSILPKPGTPVPPVPVPLPISPAQTLTKDTK